MKKTFTHARWAVETIEFPEEPGAWQVHQLEEGGWVRAGMGNRKWTWQESEAKAAFEVAALANFVLLPLVA